MADPPIPTQAIDAALKATLKRFPHDHVGLARDDVTAILEAAAPYLGPPAIIRVQGPDLTEAQVAELREKFKAAARTGHPEVLADAAAGGHVTRVPYWAWRPWLTPWYALHGWWHRPRPVKIPRHRKDPHA